MKKWICTTQDSPFQLITTRAGSKGVAVVHEETEQTIRGFGACFNELGQIALLKLDPDKRKEVLSEFFLKDKANLRFCRLPIGASDFSAKWYSHNESEGDYQMENHSLERDHQYLIPFIQDAKEIANNLELFASPWSPPTWMKTPPVYNFGRLNSDEKNLKAYAIYFCKFLKGYAKEGIDIKRLCVQNEVFADQKFPSCLWTGELMRDFIRDYLVPEMKREGLDTELFLGTINGPFFNYEMGNWHTQNLTKMIVPVMLDKQVAKEIKGFAMQWGGKHVLPQINAQYPDMEIIQSECECGDGKNDYASVFYVFDLMWQYFNHGASAFVYWNFALESDAVSTWGWNQNSLVSVDASSKQVRFNPEFYLMKHFSSFVHEGANKVSVSGNWSAFTLAFENQDGSLVNVIANPMEHEQAISIKEQVFILPPKSINTIIF